MYCVILVASVVLFTPASVLLHSPTTPSLVFPAPKHAESARLLRPPWFVEWCLRTDCAARVGHLGNIRIDLVALRGMCLEASRS